MAQRKKIALIYSYNENWIGGTYYIENLVSAFKSLKENEQPIVGIFTNEKKYFEKLQSTTGYDNLFHITPFHYSLIERGLNKIWQWIFRKKLIDKLASNSNFDLVYPIIGDNPSFHSVKNKVHWIPDFQANHLPDFFSEEQIEKRNSQNFRASLAKKIVFSSQDALKDFRFLFPKSVAQTYVVNFAVTLPEIVNINFNHLKEKYHLDDIPYFICSNQFWIHKNHMLLLEAMTILKNQDLEIRFILLFTGKMHDPRAPDYCNELLTYIEKNNLNEYCRFLGFIPREDQLVLMQNSMAIIQPSLFEGWSTVVEDAKALSQPILLSDIAVHREQINKGAIFFNPYLANELADHLVHFMRQEKNIEENSQNYDQNITQFAKDILNVID